MKPHIFQYQDRFNLEQGGTFPSLNVAYHTYGTLNKQADNVIWVCHHFTASSEIDTWWHGMIGKGNLLDPDHFFIVCANMIGSCYGSTGPTSANPETGLPWYRSFPEITIRDQVKAFELLRIHLGIRKIHTVVGVSMGGFQALEYSIMFPSLMDHLVFIASSVKITPWVTAFNQSQRLAIEADHSYFEDRPYGGSNGLKSASSFALLSQRNETYYNLTQKENNELRTTNLKASTFQDQQGEKLVRRFDAYSYHALTRIMDTHNIVRERGSLGDAVGEIKSSILSIGISSDLLFPVHEQKLLAHLSNGTYREIDSPHGHEGYLLEHEKLAAAVNDFWQSNLKGSEPEINENQARPENDAKTRTHPVRQLVGLSLN